MARYPNLSALVDLLDENSSAREILDALDDLGAVPAQDAVRSTVDHWQREMRDEIP
jgi:hypothetical protein